MSKDKTTVWVSISFIEHRKVGPIRDVAVRSQVVTMQQDFRPDKILKQFKEEIKGRKLEILRVELLSCFDVINSEEIFDLDTGQAYVPVPFPKPKDKPKRDHLNLVKPEGDDDGKNS